VMFALQGVLADANGDDWNHMGWGGGWMWLWGIAMMALLVVLIVWLVRIGSGATPGGTPTARDPGERAREILAERFARGELSTEEYRERVAELS